MASLSIINTARVQELRDEFGAEDMAFVVESFMDETAEAIAELEEMISPTEDADRCAKFHFIAGSAQTIGADQLAETCKDHEMNDRGFSRDDYAVIRSEFRAARAWFNQEFGLKDSDAA